LRFAVDSTGFGHDAWERIKGKMGRKGGCACEGYGSYEGEASFKGLS